MPGGDGQVCKPGGHTVRESRQPRPGIAALFGTCLTRSETVVPILPMRIERV